MSHRITLITPTGSRPEAFVLCTKYMMRQTAWLNREMCDYVEWIVVDDGQEPMGAKYFDSVHEDSIGRYIKYVRPLTLWRPGLNTHRSNIEVAMSMSEGDIIFFIEDDDWYHPQYIESLLVQFDRGYEMAGERCAKYYCLHGSNYKLMNNKHHASLCQTAFVRKAVPLLFKAMDGDVNDPFFDIPFWRLAHENLKTFLAVESRFAVGIKGMPGRFGIGTGHVRHENWPKDKNDYSVLRGWIGEEDAKGYMPFITE